MKRLMLILVLFSAFLSCKSDKKGVSTINDVESTISEKALIPTNRLKEVYFGETHLHTKFSLDAFIGGNRLTPDESFKFAKG